MAKYILAHDLGTSGNKATLFDEEGRLVSSYTAGYETFFREGNQAEQNPEDWWQAVCRSTREVLSGVEATQLEAVAFSGQMMGCLCVDSRGRPLRNALIYCDQRSEKQIQELTAKISQAEIYNITGHRPSSSYTLSKVMWIRDHEPEIFQNTYKILQAKDYMNFRLTGNFYTDFNDASGTNAFDLLSKNWSGKILENAALNPSLFPEPVSSSTIIGEVTRDAERQTGIPAGTPVAAGAGDGGCATLGSGSINPGQAYCYMGSSSWVSVTATEPAWDKDMRTFTWAHPIAGLYHPCGTMQTAGSAFNWFSNLFSESLNDSLLEELNQLAGKVPAGSKGLFFLPYLLGERSPWWNPLARGGFIGLNMNTGKGEMMRSVVEGIAMNLKMSLAVFQEFQNIQNLTFIGGGARGDIWRRIIADVFNLPIKIPTFLLEATSMGAALLGGVGAGVYKDYSQVELMNPTVKEIQPDPENAELYKRMVPVFSKLYKSIEWSFGEIEQLSGSSVSVQSEN